ncbi:MAG: flagellar hook capping FlgD N-terminal domain-containing protein [Acidobacteriota bacterium]
MQVFPNAIGAAQQPQDTGSSSSTSSSTSNTATVTANDFLQLLIAEMRNQDPTTSTDPTQYIDQLVQVNSLEQLVQINQDLGGGTASSTGASGNAVAGSGGSVTRPSSATAAGNLTAASPGAAASAATRVAGALGSGTHPAAPAAVIQTEGNTGNRFDALVAAMRGRGVAASTTNSPAR